MSDHLQDTLRAELDRRLAVAKAATEAAATEAPSEVFSVSWPRTAGKDALIAYYALHDPADAIRRYEGELEVLQRHAPMSGGSCEQCWHGTPDDSTWPCPEIRSLAGRLGVNVDG